MASAGSLNFFCFWGRVFSSTRIECQISGWNNSRESSQVQLLTLSGDHISDVKGSPKYGLQERLTTVRLVRPYWSIKRVDHGLCKKMLSIKKRQLKNRKKNSRVM